MQGRSWADLGHILNRLVRAGKEGALPSGSPSLLLCGGSGGSGGPLRRTSGFRHVRADRCRTALPAASLACTRRHCVPHRSTGPGRPGAASRVVRRRCSAWRPRAVEPSVRDLPDRAPFAQCLPRRRLRPLAGHDVRRPRPRGAGTGSRPGARSHCGRDRPRLVPRSDVGERVSPGAMDPPRDRRTPSRPGGPRPDPGPGRARNCSASFCAGDCPIILQRVDSPVREPECAVAVPM